MKLNNYSQNITVCLDLYPIIEIIYVEKIRAIYFEEIYDVGLELTWTPHLVNAKLLRVVSGFQKRPRGLRKSNLIAV